MREPQRHGDAEDDAENFKERLFGWRYALPQLVSRSLAITIPSHANAVGCVCGILPDPGWEGDGGQGSYLGISGRPVDGDCDA